MIESCPFCGSPRIEKTDNTYRCLEVACGMSWEDEKNNDQNLAGLSDEYISGLSMYNDEEDL